MNSITVLFDFVMNLSDNMSALIHQYGIWAYLILFLIIFCETGLVVTPFLPGDSLLFAAGALAAFGAFNLALLFAVFALAAIIGDTANYWIGYWAGPKIFGKKKIRFLKKEYLDRTHRFYEKHGGKTIFLTRFIPILRTFAPFVAGIGTMKYPRFILYNITGGFVWVAFFLFMGYWFGNIPVVRENFSIVVIVIIIISFIPLIADFLYQRYRTSRHLPKSKKEKASVPGQNSHE